MSKLRTTRHDLPEKARRALVDLLNARLADTIDLALAFKQAHWNIRGAHFIALHELFGRMAGSITGGSDELAERAKALGGQALFSLHAAAKQASQKAYPVDATSAAEHLGALIDRTSEFAKKCRAAVDASVELGDSGTSDLFTALSRSADQHLWFLEAQSDPA